MFTAFENHLLEIENARKVYPSGGRNVHALDGVSLTVAAREFVAVQGPSGSGKTTLLLIAGSLLAPSDGKVLITGEDPYALTAERRARFRASSIGFVFQQFHLVPYLSVLDNVLAAAMATGLPNARDRALELLARFGMTHRAHHVPAQLSTGERQRTALARALLNQPKLLLADEPTGNLDRENAETVLNDLAEFADNGGAVLLVTHDERAASFAQRTIRLESGQVALPSEQARATAEP